MPAGVNSTEAFFPKTVSAFPRGLRFSFLRHEGSPIDLGEDAGSGDEKHPQAQIQKQLNSE